MYKKLLQKLKTNNVIFQAPNGERLSDKTIESLLGKMCECATDAQIDYLCKTAKAPAYLNNTLPNVINMWLVNHALPDNPWVSVCDLYRQGGYDLALTKAFKTLINVHKDALLMGECEELTINIVKTYTTYLDDSITADLVGRILYADWTANNPITGLDCTISEWFAYCSKQGWLTISPYIFTDVYGKSALVLKYNRVIKFDGERFSIMTSKDLDSYWQFGAAIPRDIWKFNNRNLNSFLLWTSILSVGCHMQEFCRLYKSNRKLLEEFIIDISNHWTISIAGDSLDSIFRQCLYKLDRMPETSYRLARDNVTDYARLNVIDWKEGYIVVPTGIYPRAIHYNIDNILKMDKVTKKNMLLRYSTDRSVRRVILSGVLAAMGIILDEQNLYLCGDEKYMRVVPYGMHKCVKCLQDIDEM